MTSVIRLQAVSKSYFIDEVNILKDAVLSLGKRRRGRREIQAVKSVSFAVRKGECVALLGPNGSGKSTVLKMLAGVIRPTEGVIQASGRIVPLLELGAGFHQDLTGRENILLHAAIQGLTRREALRTQDSVLAFADLREFGDVPLKFYSSGMAARLGFAAAMVARPDILLLDEVLAVGDRDFREKSTEAIQGLRSRGATVILVTHSEPQARSFCERAITMEGGQVVADTPIGALQVE